MVVLVQYYSPWPLASGILKYNLSEYVSIGTVQSVASGILKYYLSEDESTGTVLEPMANGNLK